LSDFFLEKEREEAKDDGREEEVERG